MARKRKGTSSKRRVRKVQEAAGGEEILQAVPQGRPREEEAKVQLSAVEEGRSWKATPVHHPNHRVGVVWSQEVPSGTYYRIYGLNGRQRGIFVPSFEYANQVDALLAQFQKSQLPLGGSDDVQWLDQVSAT